MKKHSFKFLATSAFTMIELVFVIVVIGILAAVIIPNTRTNPLQEAAIQLVSHIRYTQHLALVDDKYNAADATWFKARWQIAFISSAAANGGPSYTIYADTAGAHTGDADQTEIAVNPENSNQLMTGGHSGSVALDIRHNSFIGMKRLNLKENYGLTDLSLSNTCQVSGSKRIYFDYMGRPIKGKLGTSGGGGNTTPYESDNLITQNCLITLTDGNKEIQIRIAPETGYACILDINSNCI